MSETEQPAITGSGVTSLASWVGRTTSFDARVQPAPQPVKRAAQPVRQGDPRALIRARHGSNGKIIV